VDKFRDALLQTHLHNVPGALHIGCEKLSALFFPIRDEGGGVKDRIASPDGCAQRVLVAHIADTMFRIDSLKGTEARRGPAEDSDPVPVVHEGGREIGA
jgi:hypothetical protein